ncbi:MAG: hypothetical protein ABI316_09845, partial [Casimicrobiaceae bacterium]
MRSTHSRASAVTYALVVLVLAGTSALHAPTLSAHEPDAEEIALGSLVNAEMAFARMGWERGVRAAFLAN